MAPYQLRLSKPSAQPSPSADLWSLQTWLTIALLAGFSALTTYLTRRAGAAEPEWSRLVYLFGSVEALVFAAVGAALGTQISIAQVRAAQAHLYLVSGQLLERTFGKDITTRTYDTVKKCAVA